MPRNMEDMLKYLGKNYMVVIKPDSNDWQITLLESIPDLEMLKKGLDGGLLEIVPRFTKFLDQPCVVFVDEEGKLKGLKPNETAQFLWNRAVDRVIYEDHLVGPVVIVVGSPSFLARL